MKSSKKLRKKAGALIEKNNHFQLYVVGKTTKKNKQLVGVVDNVLNKRFKGRFVLEVIDVLEHPEKAARGDIWVPPTWPKKIPPPQTKVVGDFVKAGIAKKALEILIQSGNEL